MSFSIFLQKFIQFNFFNLFLFILIFEKIEFSKHHSQQSSYSINHQTKLKNDSPIINWTRDYSAELANFALDFAAASYSSDPIPCLKKHNATLEKFLKLKCDYLNNEV